MSRIWIGLIAAVFGASVLVTTPDTGSAAAAPDTYGLVDPSTGIWHLYEGGTQTTQFYFGNPGDFPFMGDWNCNDEDTPGLYRQSDGYVYLSNSNTQGIADISFFFGNPGDVPIAGDFNSDGCDTVSIYRPSNQTFYIINKLGTNDGGLGAAEYSFVFGNPGDKPFIGDFNGNGQDTIGLHRESTGLVYFRKSNSQGNADDQFIFGDPNDRIVAGDWTGNGVDSPGLFRPSNTTMYLRYENTQGNADASWMVGSSTWLPVAGRFKSSTPPPTSTSTTTTSTTTTSTTTTSTTTTSTTTTSTTTTTTTVPPLPAGTISGTVTDAVTGAPLLNITVEVISGDGGGGVGVGGDDTAADGTYEVTGLEPGTYSLSVVDLFGGGAYVAQGRVVVLPVGVGIDEDFALTPAAP